MDGRQAATSQSAQQAVQVLLNSSCFNYTLYPIMADVCLFQRHALDKLTCSKEFKPSTVEPHRSEHQTIELTG